MSRLLGICGRSFLLVAVIVFSGNVSVTVLAQEQHKAKLPSKAANLGMPVATDTPELDGGDRLLPISLPAALRLANGRAIDIALAAERIRQSEAQLQRAKVLWLPTVYIGGDYFRHDGQQQSLPGEVAGASRGQLMAGAGPSAVFAFTDAIFAPLSARQVVRARSATWQAATNDTILVVAEAYFAVQQWRGELAGALDALKRSEDLVRRTEKLAEGLVPAVEASRARADLAERRQDAETVREKLLVASADLLRLLRLDPTAVVQPVEPPHLRVTLIPSDRTVDELIPLGLTARPELAAQQALVQAALTRLRQEKIRPLVPSVLLRGASTPVTGTLAGGYFGGGRNDNLSNFSARSDFDVQILWEFQNLGFGNRALIKERRSEHQQSILELFRVQDKVAAEIAQAHAQSAAAAKRAEQAETGLKEAIDSVEKNFEGMGQTKRAGNVILLVIRPQEAVAAVQALGRAYNRYYGAVADYNRAQYRLYRALGEPGQMLADGDD